MSKAKGTAARPRRNEWSDAPPEVRAFLDEHPEFASSGETTPLRKAGRQRVDLDAPRGEGGRTGHDVTAGVDPRVDDEDDNATAGADEHEITRSLATRWAAWPLETQRERLLDFVGARWLHRFGFRWEERFVDWVAGPWVGPFAERVRDRFEQVRRTGGWTRREPSRAGRRLGPRAFVIVWDERLPFAPPERPSGEGTRFLSVLELTWASLLGGNWPRAGLNTPGAVLKAEREAIKKVLARYGRPPRIDYEHTEVGDVLVVPKKVQRGPRRPHGRDS